MPSVTHKVDVRTANLTQSAEQLVDIEAGGQKSSDFRAPASRRHSLVAGMATVYTCFTEKISNLTGCAKHLCRF